MRTLPIAANNDSISWVNLSGEINVELWFKTFDSMWFCNCIPDPKWSLKLLSSLSTPTLKIVVQSGFTVTSSYEAIITHLITRFGKIKDEFISQRKFFMCKTQEFQFLVEYVEEFYRKRELSFNIIHNCDLYNIMKNQRMLGIKNSRIHKSLFEEDLQRFQSSIIWAHTEEYMTNRKQLEKYKNPLNVLAMAVKLRNRFKNIIKRLGTFICKKRSGKIRLLVEKFDFMNNFWLKPNVDDEENYATLLFLQFKINNLKVDGLVDTGSQTCLISFNFFKKLEGVTISKICHTLLAAGGGVINSEGIIVANLTLKQKTIKQSFIVVNDLLHECIVGIDALKKFKTSVHIGSVHIKI